MFNFTKTLVNILTVFSLFNKSQNILPQKSFIYSTSPTPTISQTMLYATGSINQFGENVKLNASFPQNGGIATGNISGDCTGKINGIYSGENNGRKLEGTISAKCFVMFIDIDGSATFSGKVSNDSTKADLNYTAKADNHIEAGTLTLKISSKQ